MTNEESLPVAGVWVVAVPEEQKRKQHYLFKPITTDQYGHFDLRGLAPGKYKLFSWDGVKNSDTKAIEMKLIQVKNTVTASE